MKSRRMFIIILFIALSVASSYAAFSSVYHIPVQQKQDIKSLSDFPWPMFQGNPRHTGQSPYYTGNNSGSLKWSDRLRDRLNSSVMIGANNTLYFSCCNGYLYSVSPDNKLNWKFGIGEVLCCSPAIGADGTIYVGSIKGHLYAVNPDGTLKWRISVSGNISSAPTIGYDGTIYFGSSDGCLYAVNPNGTLEWKFQTGDEIVSSPAIDSDGVIYVGSFDNYVYAVNPNGTLKWKFLTGGHVESSPAIGPDGTIYVGSDDHYLYAINKNGTLRWRFLTGNRVYSSPAIANDGTIYAGSYDMYLYALYPNGTLKWKFRTYGYVSASPVIGAEGTIYFGSEGDGLYALNPNGTLKWKVPIDNYMYSPPTIDSKGVIYITSFGGVIYAIGNHPPKAPRNFKVIVGDGYVLLKWDPPEDDGGFPITGYVIYRDWGIYARVNASVHSYKDMNVSVNRTYLYFVAAVNCMGVGVHTDIVKVKWHRAYVWDLKVNKSGDRIHLTWNVDDGGTKVLYYLIYMDLGNGWFLIGNTTSLSYNLDISKYLNRSLFGGSRVVRLMVLPVNGLGQGYEDTVKVRVPIPIDWNSWAFIGIMIFAGYVTLGNILFRHRLKFYEDKLEDLKEKLESIGVVMEDNYKKPWIMPCGFYLNLRKLKKIIRKYEYLDRKYENMKSEWEDISSRLSELNSYVRIDGLTIEIRPPPRGYTELEKELPDYRDYIAKIEKLLREKLKH